VSVKTLQNSTSKNSVSNYCTHFQRDQKKLQIKRDKTRGETNNKKYKCCSLYSSKNPENATSRSPKYFLSIKLE